MTTIRRRLFWKVYLTLLASLVAVVMLMGGLWRLLGEAPRARWGAFRLQLSDELLRGSAAPPGALGDAIRRLGEAAGADVSVYAAGGALMASQGRPVALPGQDGAVWRERGRIARIDLPDGRTVLARLRPPPGQPVVGLAAIMLAVAGIVGLAAYPMTARLTRQLERLRSGMARWGEGETSARVDETGSDEVAAVARTFNIAAERLDALLASQRALLANASHELRSPLGRLRLAVELWVDTPAAAIRAEIVRNLAEVDRLVEEILLSSRLDHPGAGLGRTERVDLLGLAAEEADRAGASLGGAPVEIDGDATLLRRLFRNLLENGAKHGRPPITIGVSRHGQEACIVVSDAGDGVAPEERERVFEPFYRPSGRSEASGGWGLGLALVRQIARRHGGRVECREAAGGGTRFVVHLASPERQQGTGRPSPAGRAGLATAGADPEPGPATQ